MSFMGGDLRDGGGGYYWEPTCDAYCLNVLKPEVASEHRDCRAKRAQRVVAAAIPPLSRYNSVACFTSFFIPTRGYVLLISRFHLFVAAFSAFSARPLERARAMV